MRLAIVGSTKLVDNIEAANIILRKLHEYWPDLVVSGGADGIDKLAVKVAIDENIPYKEYLPEGKGWYYYKKRNKLIAENCDRLIRITYPEATTYGSGWTRDYAASLGKPTEEFVVRL